MIGDCDEVLLVEVKHDDAVGEDPAQVEERAEVERANVRLGPAVAANLNVLLELDPSGKRSAFACKCAC